MKGRWQSQVIALVHLYHSLVKQSSFAADKGRTATGMEVLLCALNSECKKSAVRETLSSELRSLLLMACTASSDGY
jgi:hypothetical protein